MKSDYWSMSLDTLGVRARFTPRSTAVMDAHTGLSSTYADMEAKANALANYFIHELKLEKGDRVSLLARNSVECLWIFFAVQKSGLILVPLNWILSPMEIVDVLRLTEPKILICESELTEISLVLCEQFSFVKTIYFSGNANETDFEGLNLHSVIEKGKKEFKTESPLSPEDPLLISFTGGTTGPSKGAVLSHRSVLYNMISESLCWSIKPGDAMPCLHPFFHFAGWSILTLPTIFAGGKIILFRGFEPDLLLSVVEKERCRTIHAVPTMFEMISCAEEWWKTNIGSLEWVISGGASCPKAVMVPYWERGINFVQSYGLTEGGVHNLYLPWTHLSQDRIKDKWKSVGKPFMYCLPRIVNEQDNVVEAGERGELLLTGPMNFSGYWNNPEKTEETLKDGWVHTGDIVQQDEEGFFYIVDRKKDMYITGGEKVYPSEIEKVLAEHPAVQEAVIVGVFDPQWGEVGKAFIVNRPEQELTETDLMEFLRERIARYKIPKHFTFEESIPKTRMGKVMKKDLRES